MSDFCFHNADPLYTVVKVIRPFQISTFRAATGESGRVVTEILKFPQFASTVTVEPD